MHRSIPMTANLTPSLHCTAEQSFFQGAYHYYSHVTNYKAETRLIFLDQQLLLHSIDCSFVVVWQCRHIVRTYILTFCCKFFTPSLNDRRAISTLRNGCNTKFVCCTPATFQSSYQLDLVKLFHGEFQSAIFLVTPFEWVILTILSTPCLKF